MFGSIPFLPLPDGYEACWDVQHAWLTCLDCVSSLCYTHDLPFLAHGPRTSAQFTRCRHQLCEEGTKTGVRQVLFPITCSELSHDCPHVDNPTLWDCLLSLFTACSVSVLDFIFAWQLYLLRQADMTAWFTPRARILPTSSDSTYFGEREQCRPYGKPKLFPQKQ